MAFTNPSTYLAILLLLALSSAPTLIKGDESLIQKMCNNTRYPSLCVKTLESDRTSYGADQKGLAINMVKFGVARATGIFGYLNYQIRSPKEAKNATQQKAVKYCAGKYSVALSSLQSSVQEVERKNYVNAEKMLWKGLKPWRACRMKFKASQNVYPSELAQRESKLYRVIIMAIGMLKKL